MATAKKIFPPENNTPNAAVPKTRGYLVAGMFILLLLIIAAGAWYILTQTNQNNQHNQSSPVAEAPPVVVHHAPIFSALEPLIVNLQPEKGMEQYLQVAITLQLSSQAQVDQIKTYMPQIRSRLLILLSSKRPSELISVEGKINLSESVRDALNQPFSYAAPSLGVTNVFFTAFVIQ